MRGDFGIIYGMTVQETIAEIVAILRRRLPEKDCRIYLFGSQAKGAAEPGSDIDIGLLGAAPLDELALLRLRDEVRAIQTLRKIELVDLNKTDEGFRREVLSHGKLL